ncbi:MAG: hypothetical protein F9K23_06000 [Bacteroidetes bacterium]|nr:MAG: hypothetical protein F9K23_06000 [Bacteroidota bacterium]
MKQNTSVRIIIAVIVFVCGLASIGINLVLMPLFVFSGLLILPITSAYISQVLKMSSQGKIALSILFFITGFIGMGVLAENHPSDSNITSKLATDVKQEQPKEAVITLMAESLTVSYDENEVAADNNYKGKLFAVEGIVESIGKDIFDDPYVIIKGHNYGYNVQCYFANNNGLESLAKGQQVKIYGRCNGRSILSVLMKDSRILNE